MKKQTFFYAIFLMFTASHALSQTPDLDRLIANITVPAPPVEALDQAAIQLHYFDSVAPTPEQETKMLVAYKALSAGFAANVHYKQGYNVFQKYLNLKEKILAREKATVIANLQKEYQQKDKADEDKVVSLQNEVAQLNMDTEGFISKRRGFKNIFSIVIVVLSMIFAASLFRSGVKLKNLNSETKNNQEKLAENHRLASLGYLSPGIPEVLKSNMETIRKSAAEAVRLTANKSNIQELRNALTDISKYTGS
jgi:C4-dicarboxylate-specific signal transduction histidine kinase